MLFRKKIYRSCSYCTYGTTVSDGQVLCTKRGVVSIDSSCRKFKYEPCKRIPPKQSILNFFKFKNDDFSL